MHTWYSMHRASRELTKLHLTSCSAPVRGFENDDHHFPAAESALPAVDEPPADVTSSSRYYYFCVAAHVASLLTATFLHRSVVLLICLVLHLQQCRTHRKYVLHSCSVTYIYTYICESQCNMISCLASRSANIL